MSRSVENNGEPGFRHDQTPFPSPSRSETRAVLFKHYKKIPILYVGNSCTVLKRLNLEHVVPQSVLKSAKLQRAIDDPVNLQLSLASVNCKRKNYHFAFDMSCVPKTQERMLEGLNFVDEKRKLFVPNEHDWGFLSRILLKMHNKWGFPLRSVTVSSHSELLDIASHVPVSAKESFRETIV
jgi:endonuclease I